MVKVAAIGLVIIATFIGGVAALLLKKATAGRGFKEMLWYWMLWLGLSLYGLSSVFYIWALTIEQLSVVYPLVSLSYFWTCFFSVRYLGEKMNAWKYISLIGIIIGIVCIGIGS
jgi:drug/metabolite transporter (DMT)-like permease